jgi:hypothetical protein
LPKTFFKRNFDLTLSEKRVLDDAAVITAIDWMATISPTNANINRFEGGQYLYEEVQVICAQTGTIDFEKNLPKIAELVQKHIPYPIALCIYADSNFILNACNKRINQNDSSRRTIEDRFFSEVIDINNLKETQVSFLDNLAFGKLDKTNLKTLYDGYSQAIIALQAAAYSGIYMPRTKERTDADLQNMQILQNEIVTLQGLAKKETQLNQQVAINLHVQEKRREIERLKSGLME